MKIAIVIGISDYANIDKLPGCITDKKAITQLLEKTENYTDILTIDENKKTSASIKQEIISFVSQYQNKKENIEEVFFYFSGHGVFRDDEFFYIFPDFDDKKFKQTSFENSELDILLKSLSPALTIKVIDACHSGISYIKDKNLIESYIKGTQKEFESCYFFFSSQSSESSFQSDYISYFTLAFIEAIAEFSENEEIRYKDIIDHISDSFTTYQNQTPYFVSQAKFTEVFCQVTSEIKSLLRDNFLDTHTEREKEDDTLNPSVTVYDLVKKDAKRYCTEEETMEYLNKLVEYFQKYKYDKDLSDLYEFKTAGIDNFNHIDLTAIGTWLSQNNHRLFATHTYKTISVTVNQPKRHPLLGFSTGEYETVTKNQKIIEGFKSNVSFPYKYISIKAIPTYPNLVITDCKIIPLVSECDIRLFYSFANYRKVSWQDIQQDNDLQWSTESFPTKDIQAIEEIVNLILEEFEGRIQFLLSKYFL